MSRLTVRPCGVTTARLGVRRLHRHLPKPPPGALVAFEVVGPDGWPVGWALVGRPASRVLQARGWVSVTRVAVVPVSEGGPQNACSMLYGAAARWARRRGAPIDTYTRVDEPGTSLRAAGWLEVGRTDDRERRTWDCATRPRVVRHEVQKVRWAPPWAVSATALPVVR